jgi:hypothetical protein
LNCYQVDNKFIDMMRALLILDYFIYFFLL